MGTLIIDPCIGRFDEPNYSRLECTDNYTALEINRNILMGSIKTNISLQPVFLFFGTQLYFEKEDLEYSSYLCEDNGAANSHLQLRSLFISLD
jgi:hypothetical protein